MDVATSVFNSCNKDDDPPANPTYDEGVEINGIKWATRRLLSVLSLPNPKTPASTNGIATLRGRVPTRM